MDIIITAMRVVAREQVNKNGDVTVAYFDAIVGPVVMRGAALVKLKSGDLSMWEPLSRESDPSHQMRLNGATRKEVARKALPVFEILAGRAA